MTRKERAEVIEMVAAFIEQFDGYVLHPWRLSDVIRFKFCILRDKRRIRRTKLRALRTNKP